MRHSMVVDFDAIALAVIRLNQKARIKNEKRPHSMSEAREAQLRLATA